MAESGLATKLSAARTRLILDKPFFGALVMRMPLLEGDPHWCKTIASDARSIYYNAEYLDALSINQLQFLLSHEVLHCALSHFFRRQHRSRALWDIACDLAINPLLLAEGLTPSPDAIVLDNFSGMSAEAIYPMVAEHEHLTPHDEHIYDDSQQEGGERGEAAGGGSGQQQRQDSGGGASEPPPFASPAAGQGAPRPQPLTLNEREQLAQQWSQNLAGAAQMALQAGKLSGLLQRQLQDLLQPQLSWRALLARYMTLSARSDYNYSRPSRREGSAIFPSLKSHAIQLLVAIDSSGSVSDSEMASFAAEVNAIKGQLEAQITLVGCDSDLAVDGPWIYERWEPFTLPTIVSGGGTTDFRPVFDFAAQLATPPDLILYFTDARGRFPLQQPAQPVIWLVKGNGSVPWGERIQLNA
ncbi:MAG: hypothetical protein HQL49_02430 [Gammaproteobacteria bacterium]|nr:hypothetical protein [Gammaproteobacteria bacterium]